jgi:arylsulfatase A-like enzyme
MEGAEDLARPAFCERERGARHFQRLIRTQEWKYVYASDGASQLYNLEKDPGETQNLIKQSGTPRAELHARLGRWMSETADNRRLS